MSRGADVSCGGWGISTEHRGKHGYPVVKTVVPPLQGFSNEHVESVAYPHVPSNELDWGLYRSAGSSLLLVGW